MKIKLTAALLFLGCAAFAALKVEPPAPVFENDQVKVVRALEKPHVKGKFHEHTMDRVMVYLQPGKQRFEYQGGKPTEVFDWTAGQAVWSPAGGMHSPEVISDEPFNIIEILLNKAPSGKAVVNKLDPVKLDPKRYHVEFENDKVRVIRVKIEPHGITPMHAHALNRVTVFLTDQDFRVKDVNGKVDLVKRKAGDAVWGTPLTHSEENISDQPFEIITVEIKG